MGFLLFTHYFCVFIFQSSLSEGCRLPVRMQGTDDWPLAEIISIRDVLGKNMYYVHYVDCECSRMIKKIGEEGF